MTTSEGRTAPPNNSTEALSLTQPPPQKELGMKPTNLSDAITHLTHLLKSEFEQHLSQSSDLTDLTNRLDSIESDMPCSEDIASLDERVSELENQDFDDLNERLEAIENCNIDDLSERLENLENYDIQSVIESLGDKDLEERLEKMETLVDKLTPADERLNQLECALEDLNNRLTPLEEELEEDIEDDEAYFTQLDERLEKLEKLVSDQNSVIFALTQALLKR